MSKKRSSVKKRERNKYKRDKRALQVKKKGRRDAHKRAAASVGASSFAADLLEAARQIPNVEGRRTMARQAVDEDPDFAYAWAFLAEQAETPGAALELYDKAVAAAERRLAATREAMEEMGDPDEDDPEAEDPRDGFDEEALEALSYVQISRLYMQALQQFGGGKKDQARKLLVEALREAPTVAQSLLEAGRGYDDDPAVQLAESTRALWETAEALPWLANVYRG